METRTTAWMITGALLAAACGPPPIDLAGASSEEHLVQAIRDGDVPLLRALAARHPACLRPLPGAHAELGPLALAVELDERASAEALLSLDVPVNERSEGAITPLHVAAHHGHAWAVECLLRHGADADARTARGRTPLQLAVLAGHADVVEELRRVTDLAATDELGLSALHLAAMLGEDRLVAALTDELARQVRGSDAHGSAALPPDASSMTALHRAALAAEPRCIELLLRGSSDGSYVDARDALGRTALHYAARRGDARSIELLRRFGATEVEDVDGVRRSEVRRTRLLHGPYPELGAAEVAFRASAAFGELAADLRRAELEGEPTRAVVLEYDVETLPGDHSAGRDRLVVWEDGVFAFSTVAARPWRVGRMARGAVARIRRELEQLGLFDHPGDGALAPLHRAPNGLWIQRDHARFARVWRATRELPDTGRSAGCNLDRVDPSWLPLVSSALDAIRAALPDQHVPADDVLIQSSFRGVVVWRRS